jgi:PAS domain S-box-containing protein
LKELHSLLKRQLKRLFDDKYSLDEEVKKFISIVNDTYYEYDSDRAMLERSLEISSTELVQNNSEMRAIFQAIPDLLFRIDRYGYILDFKAGGMTDFFLRPKDLLGKKIQNVPDKHVGDIFLLSINEVIATNSIVSFEYPLQVNNAASFYEARLLPLPEDQLIVMIQNITNRKKVEEALKENEKFLRTTINVMSDIVCFKDGVGRWELANDYALKVLKLEGFNYIGKKDSELAELSDIHKNSFLNCMDTDRIAWEKGTQSRSDEIIIQPDGSQMIFDFVKIPTFTPDGNRKGLIIVGRDITERKHNEEELIQLSQAVRQSPAAIVRFNHQKQIDYVNPKFTELTGYTPKEVLGQEAQFFLTGILQSKAGYDFWNNITEKEEWENEFLSRKKDGSLIWVSTSVSPIRNLRNEITHFLAVSVDITEKKTMELNLKKALDKAEGSDRLKSSLLANMSHEFRTPVNGILGISNILKDMCEEPEKKEMLDLIISSSKRLMSTLSDVLELADLESEKSRRIQALINISEVIAGINNKAKNKAAKKGLDFISNIKCDDLLIRSSTRDLSHIIDHLIDNAIKFTIQGDVEVTLEKELIENELFAKLTVSDTGIGIPKECNDIIFEEFRQVSEGFSRSHEGAGLGLALVKKIVALLNGKITVSSELGQGSNFIVHLPAIQSMQIFPQQAEIKSVKTSDESAHKIPNALPEILLVEDNLLNRKVIEVYLLGICKVDQAVNGTDAINLAKMRQYDLILMDINLGRGIDGIATAKEIRKLSNYQNTPIVAVTGYARESEKEEILKKGITHFLPKPFDKTELINLVTSIINNN